MADQSSSSSSKATSKAPPRKTAVALSWQAGVDPAPKVVATGQGAVAERILELAFAHGIKVRTDPDLTQILAAVDVDTTIPVEAFVAVAEILAYLYQANNAVPDVIEAELRQLHPQQEV